MGRPAAGPPGLHSALIGHMGFLIDRIGTVARKRFSQQLETLGLNLRMWGVLNVLDAEGAITQHAVGRCVGIDPSSMVATIDELETRGLVHRGRHPTDRRAHALELTADGRETLAAGRALARQAQDELLAPLTLDEREQLHDLLHRVAMRAAAPGDADGQPPNAHRRPPDPDDQPPGRHMPGPAPGPEPPRPA